ncbi:39S ribosomal protein L38, mitochondrial-like [Acropora millepora]|uniref:39S ribosomal protein L38, mitochondrial-like n=1 Tax=Acropora millepora TaxID=45264 RepID=UPI001CF2F960|nr:39S ribosomal protein L38, mitochondrial-like [Acropora millepora]
MAVEVAKCWCVLGRSKRVIFSSLARKSLLLGRNSICIEASGATEMIERPTKRKAYRKMKAEVYRKNKQDSNLERAARNNTLLVPLETVRKEWMAKSQSTTLAKLARHYGIFEHMFEKKEFMPTVGMSVTFGETDHVHYGNFLTPSQAMHEPRVSYDCTEGSHWMLVLANPDGNFLENRKEVLHWMIYNIPGSRISGGEVICEYLPPIPIQGTGFHRFVFCLIKQSGELDFRSDLVIRKPSDITSRSFSLAELLSKHSADLTPAGLCFFQASWDKSVTQTFLETLGITEPAYKEKEFVTPTKARKILVKNWLESKYRNM